MAECVSTVGLCQPMCEIDVTRLRGCLAAVKQTTECLGPHS